jgi:uncharacterized phiE125 gp8 family phage protein
MLKKPIPLNDGGDEPVSLATARLHLRLDTEGSPPTHPDDELVAVLISAARESAENYTGLAILRQTFQLQLDAFPGNTEKINLGLWPVNAINSITYLDENGATQTLAADKYVLENNQAPAQVGLAFEEVWPATRAVANAVTIEFVAGYTDGLSPNPYPMPKAIKQAMLLTIGHLYQNRQDVSDFEKFEMPFGSLSLLTPFRISMGL